MRSARSRRSCCWLAVGLSCSGCLPADTRPVPGRALVSVHASDSLLSGVPAQATEDGWAIQYQRLLLGLGRVDLEGDRCTTYSDADYTRLFDMLVPGAQKVSEQYALGSCSFSFRVVPPSSDSLLGAGVSDADAVLMRTPPVDPAVPRNGISLYVQGQASKGATTVHFTWPFRWRIAYEDCVTTLGSDLLVGVQLASGDDQEIPIEISGEALFRDDPDPDRAKLRFDAFAAADAKSGNADGEVSLEELSQVKLADLSPSGGYQRLLSFDPAVEPPVDPAVDPPVDPAVEPPVDPAVDRPGLPPFVGAEPTLADFLYVSALPGVARFRDDGSCQSRVRARFEEFD